MNQTKPTTHQGNLAKIATGPLKPLTEREQWCIWRWTQKKDGMWQKPPYQAADPDHHASTSDPTTWCSYEIALAAVQAGRGDGISYVLTAADPFTAFDLDHCRNPRTHSLDIWSQNFLDVTRATYAEVTPSGDGIRIWGLTADGTTSVNKKFTLEIDGKPIAAEIFRRAPKILTVTGYRLDTVKVLANIDKAVTWAITWGERRKAAALEAAAATQANGHEFNAAGGSGHDIEYINKIVREGAQGGNRSDSFHVVVGHYLGCDWGIEQIYQHLQQFPDGIGSKYIGEGRLRGEIERSARKFEERQLPLSGGWMGSEGPAAEVQSQPLELEDDAELEDDPAQDQDNPDQDNPEPTPELKPEAPPKPDPEDDDPPELDDNLSDDDDPPELDDDDFDGEPEQPDPKLPKLHMHGEPDTRPLVEWLIKDLVPKVGHGLLVGQWGTYKTFVGVDMAASAVTGQAFLDHPIKQQCGVMWIAAEGASQVRARLDAVVKEKCGGERIPFRPLLCL
jgi:AAA domain